jgi:hypothetical protein
LIDELGAAYQAGFPGLGLPPCICDDAQGKATGPDAGATTVGALYCSNA